MATTADSTLSDDKLTFERYTGWRSAVNHLVRHPFHVVTIVANDELAEYNYFWAWDLPACQEQVELLAPWARNVNKPENEDAVPGDFSVIIGILEIDEKSEDVLVLHHVKTFHFDSSDGAKVRKAAKSKPEIVFFDIEEERRENIIALLRKQAPTVNIAVGAHKQAVKAKKERSASKVASPASAKDAESDSVPELDSDHSKESAEVAEDLTGVLEQSIKQVNRRKTSAKPVAKKVPATKKVAAPRRQPRKQVQKAS